MVFVVNKNAANPSLETNLSAVPLCLEAFISPSLNAYNARLRICLLSHQSRNPVYNVRIFANPFCNHSCSFVSVHCSADLLPDALPFPPVRTASSSTAPLWHLTGMESPYGYSSLKKSTLSVPCIWLFNFPGIAIQHSFITEYAKKWILSMTYQTF